MKKHTQTISILGCGWLGLPLAERLLSLGYTVKGSTTQEEKLAILQEKGISPYLLHFSPEINADHEPGFFESDTLVLNIPPSRKQADIASMYPKQIAEVLKQAKAKSVKNILFVSSTSVYPNLNRAVREADAGGDISTSGKTLLEVEEMLQMRQGFRVTILRLCGLYDERRNPGRFLAGRSLNSNGQDCVNLIHREDCVEIIIKLLEKDLWGEVFNACSDEHPAKATFYPLAATKLGLEPPSFSSDAPRAYKIIDSCKLKDQLGYTFQYPDPVETVKNL